MLIYIKLGFLGGSDSKESACNAGDPSDSWVRKILWRRDGLPTPVFCLGNPMDRGACRLQSMGSQKSQTRFKTTNAQRKDHVKILRVDGHLQAKERGLRRNQYCWHLDLGFPASRTVRKLIYTVQGSQLVISVLAALEDG